MSTNAVFSCPSCQRNLSKGSEVCPYCGQDLCPECGAAVSPQDIACLDVACRGKCLPVCEREVSRKMQSVATAAHRSLIHALPHCSAQVDADLTTCRIAAASDVPTATRRWLLTICNATVRRKVVLTCPDCGAELDAKADKCPNCGADLYEPTSSRRRVGRRKLLVRTVAQQYNVKMRVRRVRLVVLPALPGADQRRRHTMPWLWISALL